MVYKIIFYAAAVFFVFIALLVLAVFRRRGTTNLVPVHGLMLGYTRIDTQMYDETADAHFISHKLVIGLLFIFIAMEWESGAGTPPDDTELKPEVNGN